MKTRAYTDDMQEISGFGGGYEEQCRKMVLAGLDWFDAHPDADPRYEGYKGIFGFIQEDNEDAKALSKAVTDACEGGATGAMHQATIGHILAIRKMGWDAYVAHMREPEAPEAA